VIGTFNSNPVSFNNDISFSSYGYNDDFVSKYDTSGNCIWAKQIGGTYDDNILGIATDTKGDIYIAGGFFSRTLTFNDNISLQNPIPQYSDAFIAKISANGDCLWAQSYSGTNHDVAKHINVNSANKIFIAGDFSSPTINISKDRTLVNNGKADGFLLMCEQTITYAITNFFYPIIYCNNSVVDVKFAVSSAYNSGNIFTAQLSDQFGKFTNPTAIGTFAGTGSGSISATIPSNTVAGNAYRIRVVSSDPVAIGSQNKDSITINPLPVQYALTGSGSYCIGEKILPIAISSSQIGTSYQLYMNGDSVSSPVIGTGAQISFDEQSTSGTFTVIATNTKTSCSREMSNNVIITINPLPEKPTIKEVDKVLQSSTALAYQWYLGDSKIDGEIKQTYKPDKKGLYKVEITDEIGCKNTSDAYDFDVLGISDGYDNNINIAIHPTPSSGITSLTLDLKSIGKVSIKIMDIIGIEVAKICSDQDLIPGIYKYNFDGSYLSSGTYLCIVEVDGDITVKRLLIVK
jgi:hypothetical protein